MRVVLTVRGLYVGVIGGVVAAVALVAGAQPTPAPDAAPPAAAESGIAVGGGVPTVAALFMTNPYINGALLVLSVIALMMFLYFLATLRSAGLAPPRMMNDLTRMVLDRQFDQAVNLCQNNPSVFASGIIQRCLENRDKDHGVLVDILNTEGKRRSEVVWNRIGYLADIGSIAPMLGLTGTVIGMMYVFFDLDTPTAGIASRLMSEGVAMAMATTLFGLIVAIAAGIFHSIIKGRATNVLTDTEQACHTIADHAHRIAAEVSARRGNVRDRARAKATAARSADRVDPGEDDAP